jgi:hypothetical protein
MLPYDDSCIGCPHSDPEGNFSRGLSRILQQDDIYFKVKYCKYCNGMPSLMCMARTNAANILRSPSPVACRTMT